MPVSRNKSQRSNKNHMGNNLKRCPNKTRRTKPYSLGFFWFWFGAEERKGRGPGPLGPDGM